MREIRLHKIDFKMIRKTKTKREVNTYIVDKVPFAYVDGTIQPKAITIDRINLYTSKKWKKDQIKNYECSLKIIH